MITRMKVRQIGDRGSRTFIVKQPTKMKFWKMMSKVGTAKGFVFTDILWEENDEGIRKYLIRTRDKKVVS